MADTTQQYNIHDLHDRLTRYEAALAQIAASLTTYQQLAADLRRDLNAVQPQAAVPPPGETVSRDAPPATTPPIPSAEAETARRASAMSAGMPVNVPPVEGLAAQEAKDQAQADKDKAAADKDKDTPAGRTPPSGTRRPGGSER